MTILLEGVAKAFRSSDDRAGIQALGGIDLVIPDGEFLTLLGPSGCGKTTLLRAIAGLIPVDGRLEIDGRPISGPGPDRSMVFQGFALLPWATVLQNVAFGLEMRGEGRSSRERKARDLIDLVGLNGFAERYPRELSGGMQQRVGLARALAVEPRVLLMDEPFGSLDEQSRRVLQEELLKLWERRPVTVVFVTHSMEEAVRLGDRVALMGPRPGRIEELIDVGLARPRSRQLDAIGRTPEFTSITSRLWERLRAMREPALRDEGGLA
jgi:ABC-type nitrate/sulfonate/bicarbonate transport system ATPase subunit